MLHLIMILQNLFVAHTHNDMISRLDVVGLHTYCKNTPLKPDLTLIPQRTEAAHLVFGSLHTKLRQL